MRSFLVQVSVTNQEQWEEMLATKGLTGGSSSMDPNVLTIMARMYLFVFKRVSLRTVLGCHHETNLAFEHF